MTEQPHDYPETADGRQDDGKPVVPDGPVDVKDDDDDD